MVQGSISGLPVALQIFLRMATPPFSIINLYGLINGLSPLGTKEVHNCPNRDSIYQLRKWGNDNRIETHVLRICSFVRLHYPF